MDPSPSQSATNPAQTYEAYFVPGQFRPWAEELLHRARPQAGERILDLACGTGIVARLVAERLNGQGQVVGLDFSPAMLEVARSVAAQEGVEIDWREGSAEELPFADASFDLVLIQQGLQYFGDRARAVREMHRVLVPGGRVASVTWTGIEREPFAQMIAQVIQRHLGTSAMYTPYSLGSQDALRALFEAAGFDAIEIEVVRRAARYPSPHRFVELSTASSSASVPALQTMGDEERARLVAAIRVDMEPTLRHYTQGDELVVPKEAHIVVARKGGPATG